MNSAVFAALRRALSGRLISALLRLFDDLGSWHRPDAQRFARQAVPVVEGAQTALAVLTSNFVASQARVALRTPVAPPPIPREARSRLRGVDPVEVYQRPFTAAYTALADGKQLGEALDRARVRLWEVAEGDMQQTYAESSRAAMRGLREDQRPTGWRRVLQGAESCALCTIASTQRYLISDLNPIHPNCVPVGTRVSTTGLVAMTRRSYTGELTVITTATGDEIAITSNHPVLTDQGWVPGHLVREGDHVVRHQGGHRAVSGTPREHQQPALVEDVWRSSNMSGLVSVPLTSEDFHGDGSDGEVDIIWTHGDLPTIRGVPFSKPGGEGPFVDRHLGRLQFPPPRSTALRFPGLVPSSGVRSAFAGGRPATALFPGELFTSVSGMRRRGLSGSLGGSHLCGAHQTSLGPPPQINVQMLERPTYCGTLNSVLGSQHKLGPAIKVLVGDLFVGKITPSSAAPRFDAPQVKLSRESLGVYASAGRRLLDHLAGQVELHRVIEIRSRPAPRASHVYNLHTAEGWYSANGLIVSNCDCTVAPIYGPIEDRVIEPDLLEQVHAAVKELTGVADRGGRAVDYRHIMTRITNDHGELGGMLTRPGDRFQGPIRTAS